MGLHIASEAEIRAGQTTDVYFTRTREILKALKLRQRVVAEFVVKQFPYPYRWGLFAGLEEVVELLKGMPVNLWAAPEGSVFHEHDPVMVIEGVYPEFGVYETAMLGLVCQASGVATKAARCKQAAGDRPVISFGARRMHPAISPMIERNAYIGGCDGVATLKSAELLAIEPTGTMPHALVLLVGGTEAAIKAFHRVIDRKVKRVALIDTIGDEKFEAVRAAEVLGPSLSGVRLDTPGSRRGNFVEILKEVRWELDLRGFRHVQLIASGGLDEEAIRALNPYADGYGIGTAISSAQVLDFAMDLVEIDGRPMAKRGKLSGVKRLVSCSTCLATLTLPKTRPGRVRCVCGRPMRELLQPIIRAGRLVARLPQPQAIRRSVLTQMKQVE